jgi:hypothetical protein
MPSDDCIGDWTLKRNIERYGDSSEEFKRWPLSIQVSGTFGQAKYVALILTNYRNPGSDYYWYVVEDDD